MNKKKKPLIRFKGFTDDWEQRKLHEVADIIGGGTPSTNNSDYWDGDIDWYTPAEIGDKIFVSGSIRKITEEGLKNSSAKILPANKTVLFTSRAGIGNMAILQYAGATNQGFQSLICNADIDPYFIFSMKNMIQHEAERVAAGSTFAEISGKSLGKLSFLMPKWGEQRKLGNFFQQMDNLITLHQRKCEKLKIIKKSMLENCFPKNGQKVPKIRFSGFTGDWEQRKLKDIAPLQRGFDLPTTEMCPGNYPVVMSNGIGGYHSTYKVNGPGVVTGRSGTIGKLQYIEDNYWPHNTTLWVTNFYGNNPKYIYYLYQNLDFSRFTSGSGVPTLNRNDVHDFWGNLPSIGEQLKIEKFMTNLDEFITLHQRKLKVLQN